jgi:tetratricopeptide (TPR) repeat protein
MPPERDEDGADHEDSDVSSGDGVVRPDDDDNAPVVVTDARVSRPAFASLAARIDAAMADDEDDDEADDDEDEDAGSAPPAAAAAAAAGEPHDDDEDEIEISRVGDDPSITSAEAAEVDAREPAPGTNGSGAHDAAAPRTIAIPAPTGAPPPRPPSMPELEAEELSDFEELAIEADAPPLSAPARPTTKPLGPPIKPPPVFPRTTGRIPVPAPPPMPTVRIPPPRPVVVPPLVPRPAPSLEPKRAPSPAAQEITADPGSGDRPMPRAPSEPAIISDLVPMPELARPGTPAPERKKSASAPPPVPERPERPERPFSAPLLAPPEMMSEPSIPLETDDIQVEGAAEALRPRDDDGAAPGSVRANVVEAAPLEHTLETPTALDRALGDLGEAALERRAEEVARQLDAATERRVIAGLAYELGELCERRLADEARAVKAYGRALAADPSHRPNLWAIRRVFYRRALWPNLLKLVDAEIRFARSDAERADLLVEKGRVLGERLGQPVEARSAFEDAHTLDATHQGALLELERIGNRDRDHALLARSWAALADIAGSAARKTVYLVDLARLTSDQGDHAGALEILGRAAGSGADLDRVNAERIRVAEAADDPGQLLAALDERVSLLLGRFGPGGMPDPTASSAAGGVAPDRANALRLELVAVRRRQAQVARASDAATSAWDYLQNALALAPGEPVVLADLIDLAEELRRYDDLAELVEAWQSVEGDAGRALMLSLRRADALLRGNQRDAARALLGALEATHRGFVALTGLVERDALVRKDFEELARTYQAAGDAARLGTSLGPGVTAEPDPEAAAALYVMAAEVLAREVGTDAAIEAARGALSQALEARPEFSPAIEARLELAHQTGDIADAAALLSSVVERGDEQQQRDALERLSRLYRMRGDLDGALDADRRLAGLSAADTRLPWRIEGTLAQLGKDEERAAHLEALGSTEADPVRKQLALTSAARLFERLGEIERAIELYRATLKLDPDDRFARASLTDLLRAAERWSDLVAERKAEAAQLPDGPAARRALREAAWVTEVRLEKPTEAAMAWRALLDRDPDDATALEGVARTLRAAGDALGALAALEQVADNARDGHAAEARLALGQAQEAAQRHDEAIESYRKVLALDPAGGEKAQAAALALIELAMHKGDTGLRIEASSQLASWCQDPKLRAGLAEDVGWLTALVLEDWSRAEEAFADALAAEPGRPGALLGSALVAARREDPPAMALAYAGLAGSTQMPEAASALFLRAAALATATGDKDQALARIAAARAVAPDDSGAMVVAAEAWQPPPPEIDRAGLIDSMLARAEILATRADLADDPKARASWELDRAEALEAAGRLREAGTVVATVLRGDADDLRALEALRRLARRGGDAPTLARASFALAKRLGDGEAKLALLREAASIFDPAPGARDDGKDVRAAVAVYRRILAEDIGASEFTRQCELLRQGSDVAGLVGSLSDRLAWIDGGNADGREAIALLLERATVHYGLGDRAAAITDLDALLEREPGHAEALRFRGDLALAEGDAPSAVELWRRYLKVERRPDRRGEVELVLARVLAENINDLAGAVEQLARVLDASPDDPAMHERMVNLATRAGDWPRVAVSLRELGRLRGQSPERARDELRLATVLRDRLNDRTSARLALDRARGVDPLNLDVVRELAELLEQPARGQVLAGSANDLRVAIARAPARVATYEKLATVAAWQSDADARWLALLAVEAMGQPSADQRQVLAKGRATPPMLPRARLSPDQRARLVGVTDPRLAHTLGQLDELWKVIAPAVTAAVGVDAGKLGFGRNERVKKLDKLPVAAAALAMFGVDDAEVYVGGARPGIARVLSAATPIVCFATDVAEGGSPPARFWLGRSAQLAAAATGILVELRDAELWWYWAAALRVSEVPLPMSLAEAVAGEEAAVAERAKAMTKSFGRKEKKALATAEKIRTLDANELAAWRTQAINVANRAGLLTCGDLSVALAMLDAGRGGRSLVDSAPALDLVAWSVGDGHLTLRRELGFGAGK